MYVFQDFDFENDISQLRQRLLLQTWGSLQQLKTLINDKGNEKFKFQLPGRDEVRHKYHFLNQMVNAISQV